jgi:tetratricopeptide (TPR) repeat protein
MIRVLLRLVLLGAVVATAAPALAQTAPSVDKKQVAKQYVEAGLAAQSAGDYDAAITFYSKAYDLLPHPTLIFNLAQAHRLAGRIEQALVLYRRYLSEDPKGPHAGTARDLVSEIEARKTEAARTAASARAADEARKTEARATDGARKPDASRTASEAPGAEARKPDPARDAEASQPPRPQVSDRTPGDMTADAAAAAPARDTGSPEVAQPGRSQRIAGLATGAGGVAAFAIGIGFGLHARSLADELSRDGATYDPGKVHAGERANTIAIVGIAGGSALIAAGAALYWWGYTQSRTDERVSLAPMLSQHTAGLVLSGALP